MSKSSSLLHWIAVIVFVIGLCTGLILNTDNAYARTSLTELQNKIESEEAERIAGDNQLNERIDDIESASVPPGNAGSSVDVVIVTKQWLVQTTGLGSFTGTSITCPDGYTAMDASIHTSSRWTDPLHSAVTANLHGVRASGDLVFGSCSFQYYNMEDDGIGEFDRYQIFCTCVKAESIDVMYEECYSQDENLCDTYGD